ncbi:FAST kinase domain-containing protein 5, mitochondrial [Trichomycterus rosablanca]|uniref:FAST kinase domain-containing protein 5, mitochondrial n=1 Tax=Trichomycterus rosablanca TaxID=2290929 RepID=UPI002F3568A4
MSARAMWHRAAKLLLCARSPCRPVYRAQNVSSGRDRGREEKQEESEAETYALVYNPSAYYHSSAEHSGNLRHSGTEEDASQGVVGAGFRQQSNKYSISSSRGLSSSQNNLPSYSGNEEADSKNKSVNPKDLQEYLKRDARNFQRCRPEYQNISYDPSLSPPALPIKDGLVLLHKVSLMKGSVQASDIAHFLCKLGQVEPKQSPVVRGSMRFSMLLRYSVENLQNFTNLELLEILQAFVRLGLSGSHSKLGLYEAEFCRRAGHMDLHQLLLVADLWRCLGRSVPRYVEKLCDSMSCHFGQFGPAELVQFLYILGESRQCPAYLLPSVEGLILRHLDKFKGEEVGAVCLGLFKTQSPVSNAVARQIVDRACAVVEEMSDFGLVNVLKLMRFCHMDHLPWLEALSTEVPRRAPQMAVQGLMHVALTCSALHYRDDRILLAVAEHLPHVAASYRSKDAAKLLWAFGTLGVQPSKCPSLHSRLTDALRERDSEFRSYPEHLLTALLGLAFVGQFPHDLLSLALSPEFSNQVTSTLDLKKDLYTLDGTVELELPGWTGPRLSLATREEVRKQLWEFAQAELGQRPEVLEAESVLQELLGGKKFVRKRMILPHMRSLDLELQLDPSEQPQPVAYQPHMNSTPGSSWPHGWEGGCTGVTLTDDLLAQLTSGKRPSAESTDAPSQQPVLRPVEGAAKREAILSIGVDLTEDLMHALTKPRDRSCSGAGQPTAPPTVRRLAVQITSRNNYCYRTQQLLGLHAMKRRQLVLAGYTVVEVPHWEWFPLLRRSLSERLAYMHCKVFSSYDSKVRKRK